MNQVYNTQDDISSNLVNFLKKVGVWRKTQLKIIPFIVIGMILSESVVSSDIAKKLKNSFSFVNHDSMILLFVLLLIIINLNTRMANFISLLTICFVVLVCHTCVFFKCR